MEKENKIYKFNTSGSEKLNRKGKKSYNNRCKN